MPSQKCKTCGYFEPLKTMPGSGWCRYPRVDPSGVGYRKLERADKLGCREHWPLWWMSKGEWKRREKPRPVRCDGLPQQGMLFLLEE